VTTTVGSIIFHTGTQKPLRLANGTIVARTRTLVENASAMENLVALDLVIVAIGYPPRNYPSNQAADVVVPVQDVMVVSKIKNVALVVGLLLVAHTVQVVLLVIT